MSQTSTLWGEPDREKFCGVVTPDGERFCTKKPSHRGNHVARDQAEITHAEWADDDTVAKPVRKTAAKPTPASADPALPSVSVGTRIGCWVDRTERTIGLVGYGLYVDDTVPPVTVNPYMAFYAVAVPHFKLDDDTEVWGCEVEWGEEPSARKIVDRRTLCSADLSRIREQTCQRWARYAKLYEEQQAAQQAQG